MENEMDNKIILETEDGEELLVDILFSVELEYQGELRKYMYILEPERDEDEEQIVNVYQYIEDSDNSGELIEVDPNDEELWKILDEILEEEQDEE